jgi:NADH-quinone oxidoreductase subunit E
VAVAQEEHGWLSPELMQFVADTWACPRRGAGGHDVLQHVQPAPVGKFKITSAPTCRASWSTAAGKRCRHLKQKLGIDFGETTPTASSPCKKANAWAPAAMRR